MTCRWIHLLSSKDPKGQFENPLPFEIGETEVLGSKGPVEDYRLRGFRRIEP